VDINSLKVPRVWRVHIETGNKEEVELLTRDINKCGDKLEINKYKLRNTKLMLYNIP